MRKTRWLSVLLVLVLVFSLCTSAFAADPEPTDSGAPLRSSLPYPRAAQLQLRQAQQYKAGDQVRVVILMESQPTADNRHQVQRQLNTDRKLMTEHVAALKMMDQQQIGYTVNYEYTALLNGMSLTVDYADLDEIAALPGVSEVFIPAEYSIPDVQPSSNSASDMINATLLSNYRGGDGSGMVIAVLDTGITSGHEAFGIYDGMLQTPACEKVQMIKDIAGLGHGMYVSQKIPYQFDYADQDNDATDDHSGHGSHVAGIAAGFVATPEGEITFRGSAPDAQIFAMKVFPSNSNSTSSDIYYAALEDAYKLGADVINMSLGSPNGFVEDAESVLNDRIYERLENAGIICCIAAGNEDSMAEYAQNWTGGGYVTADYTDYGVLGSPASYNGNVAVASMENAEYPAYLITVDGKDYEYLDSDGTAFHDKFAGQDLEYVMVPDLGVAEAYADIDIAGKIAVISRGEITFEEKVAYASAAGAAGVIVYDNKAGALVNMSITTKTIPAVFVSQEAGASLAACAEAKLTVNEEKSIVENSEGWNMSSFTSWGPTNDLQIKPTITGIGGNVNSVLNGTADGYTVNSGTSMATPNVAGGYAAYLEAIYADHPDMSKADAAALARNRTLSHASVAIDYADQAEDGSYIYVPYSPRRQGAGLMDITAAYSAVLDITDPLAELGDDPTKAGVFTINAELENTGDTERTYEVSLDVLTDAPISSGWGTVYNAMQSNLLAEGEDYTVEMPESVTLAPGEKKTVSVTITLTDDAKDYLDTYFVNGSFIEGYVYFDHFDTETYGVEWAHATFLGYYGDWSAAPILETHDWRELMDIEIDPEYSEDPLDYVDWEINTTPTMAYLVDEEYNPQVYAGDAPFGYPEDGVYSENRIAVSYNTDSAYFTKLLVIPTIIRNARHIVMIARNAETGEIYAVDDTPYCQKTIYDVEEGWSTYAWFLFDGTNIYSEDGTPIADDTQVVMEFYANLPYGEDALGSMTPEEIVQNGAQYLAYTVPVVVDGAIPVIESCEYDAETGDVTVTVTDNQYLAAIYAVDEEGNDLAEMQVFADTEPGATNTVTLHVGEQEVFYIGALDYATNEAVKLVAAEHEHEWTEWEVTADPTCTEDGEQVRYCEICGEEESETIPAVDHAWSDWQVVTEPACEADGEQARICSNCGAEETQPIAATGHDWDEGKVTKEPTIAYEGEKLFTCKNDPSHTRTEVIAKLYDCDGGDKCPSKDYKDVDRSAESWSHEPIDWAVLKEITDGTSKTTFSPDKTCTRAEAVTFLWRAAGCPEPADADSPFADVTLDSWYAKAVLWAVEKKITNGTTDTTFSPDDTCTRGQIVTFLWRMLDEPAAKAASSFADVPADAYFAKAVDWAVEQGITDGVSATEFAPDGDCTRAHIVTFLFRQFGK